MIVVRNVKNSILTFGERGESAEMKDIKPIIAANLSKFRKKKGLTQAELAEKLNYSDKAVSRWERGDTMPDISVLYELCEFYGITLDILASEDASEDDLDKVYDKNSLEYRILVMQPLFTYTQTLRITATTSGWRLYGLSLLPALF